MYSAQFRVREVIDAVRRRWKFIAVPALLAIIVCVIGASYLPRKYESSTTILVQADQTLGPMSGYELTMALEEQLRNFNEIVHSRAVLLSLADSLGLIRSAGIRTERIEIIDEIGNNITTARLGVNVLRIVYTDTDPPRTQHAAQALAELYIQTKLAAQNRQNALAVEFYENKVQEYRTTYEASVQSLVSRLKQNVDELPLESRTLYAQLDDVQINIPRTDARLRTYREALALLEALPEDLKSNAEALGSETGIQPLLDLERMEIPFASELKTVMARHDELSRRYTSKHPDVEKLNDQISDLLARMRKAINSEIPKISSDQHQLEAGRSRIVEELKNVSVLSKRNEDIESGYDINRKLYDEMQLKLEQARLTQEVGSRGANQFIILDPALLPTRATKPNRSLIVLGGFALGIFLGILSAAVAELLDTTVRTPRDVEIYRKPVIALIPDGRHI